MKNKYLITNKLVFISLLLAACQSEEPTQEQKYRAVRTQKVSLTQADNKRIFSGVSQSQQQSTLSFKISGTIAKLPVKIGDRLSKGDLIASLDPVAYELQEEQARASLAQAKAAERNANSSFQRTMGLYENNNASKTDLDSAQANAESTRAQVKAAQKALELAHLNVNYTQISATEECAIVSTNVEVNENVNSGTPIVTVDCGNTIEVTISVPESLISEIEKGQRVHIIFDAVTDTPFSGVIDEVGVAAIGNGSTFPITVLIDDEHPELRSGLAAEVSIIFSGKNDQSIFYLPVSAINSDNQGTYIFVAKRQSGNIAIVQKKRIQIGELTEIGIPVLSGLEEGDNVITAGTKVVLPSMMVQLK